MYDLSAIYTRQATFRYNFSFFSFCMIFNFPFLSGKFRHLKQVLIIMIPREHTAGYYSAPRNPVCILRSHTGPDRHLRGCLPVIFMLIIQRRHTGNLLECHSKGLYIGITYLIHYFAHVFSRVFKLLLCGYDFYPLNIFCR